MREKQRGDRIPAAEWNDVVKAVHEVSEESPYAISNAPRTKTAGLWGVCSEDVPVFSLLEVTGTATGDSDEVPVLSVTKPSTSSPPVLFTNGEVSGTKVPLTPLVVGLPFKIDADTGDTFSVGQKCGAKQDSFQCTTASSGLICLSPAITYQSTRKFVWVVCPGGSGANFFVYEITSDFVPGSPATAKVKIYDAEDETTVIEEDQDWIGNLEMFDDGVVGSKGTCIKVGDIYFAVLSPCIPPEGGSGGTAVHIGSTPPADTSALWIDTSGI